MVNSGTRWACLKSFTNASGLICNGTRFCSNTGAAQTGRVFCVAQGLTGMYSTVNGSSGCSSCNYSGSSDGSTCIPATLSTPRPFCVP
jgi:hypothetical protein